MSARFERRRGVIAEALAGCGARVREAGPAEWSVAGRIRVSWDDPWLAFETGANGAGGRDAGWELLLGQGGLLSCCRYALAPSGEMSVVAEVVWESVPDLGARCRELLEGLEAARIRRPDPASGSGGGAPPAAVQALSEEIGWAANERSDGQLVGRFAGTSQYAELAGDGRGGSRLAVELASLPPVAAPVRSALGELLLGAGRAVRFARPTVEEHDAGCVVRYETRLAPDVTAAELGHAHAALATAYLACAGEVSALRDEAVAKEYLSVRGETSERRARPTNEKEPTRCMTESR